MIGMKKIGKQIDDTLVAARTMLRELEKALVRSGYRADGRLRIEGRKRRVNGAWTRCASYIRWKRGKILLSHEGAKSVPVDDLNEWQILFLVHHLPYFLDELERDNRWLCDALCQSLDQLEHFVQKVKDDPKPTE